MFIIRWILRTFIEPCKWTAIKKRFTGKEYDLTDSDLEEVWQCLAKENFIICTYRSTHLTSYFICAAHYALSFMAWIKTKGQVKPRWGKYSHTLMNLEETTTPMRSKDFILVEATGKGTCRSEFKTVFNCDRVVLLRPKAQIQWEIVNKKMLDMLNRPYDYNFNLNDDKSLSCVEYVLDGLKSTTGFADDFLDLVNQIKYFGNLDPSLYAESSSFEVVLLIDRTTKRGEFYARENKVIG